MYILIDVVLAAIIVLCMIIGYIKGFIDEVLDLISGVAAFIAAYFITPLVAPFVSKQFFITQISQKAAELIYALRDKAGNIDLFGGGAENEAFRSVLERFGADYGAIKEKFTVMLSEQSDKAVDAIAEHIAEPVSYALSYALCFVVIFVLVLFILWLIKHLLDLAAKLPPLEKANKALGLVVGAMLGILVVWVVSIGVKLGLPYLNVLSPQVFPSDLFERSFVLKFAYQYNVLRLLIGVSDINKLPGFLSRIGE